MKKNKSVKTTKYWHMLGSINLPQKMEELAAYRHPLLRMDDVSSKRCSYWGCDKRDQSCHFYTIESRTRAGGQDWSALVGSVLCHACYNRYRNSGTLERMTNKPLPAFARRCTYPACDRPDRSSHFYTIEEGKKAGGQDWTSVVGSVLCHACYKQFLQRGTLDRTYGSGRSQSVRRMAGGAHRTRPQKARALHPPEDENSADGGTHLVEEEDFATNTKRIIELAEDAAMAGMDLGPISMDLALEGMGLVNDIVGGKRSLGRNLGINSALWEQAAKRHREGESGLAELANAAESLAVARDASSQAQKREGDDQGVLEAKIVVCEAVPVDVYEASTATVVAKPKAASAGREGAGEDGVGFRKWEEVAKTWGGGGGGGGKRSPGEACAVARVGLVKVVSTVCKVGETPSVSSDGGDIARTVALHSPMPGAASPLAGSMLIRESMIESRTTGALRKALTRVCVRCGGCLVGFGEENGKKGGGEQCPLCQAWEKLAQEWERREGEARSKRGGQTPAAPSSTAPPQSVSVGQ